MIEFYDNDMSACAQKVRIVLEEKGLKHERHALNLRAGDQFKPEYLKLNPNAVVPTLVDDGNVIIESTVICCYLDDAYPKHPLRPEFAIGRAAVNYWIIKPDAGLHEACGITSFALAFRKQLEKLGEQGLAEFLAKIPNEKRRTHVGNMVRHGVEAPGVGEALRTYGKTVDEMEARLEGNRWLAGEEFSLADIAMLPYVLRLEHLGLDWFWPADSRVAGWLARCKARPSFDAITRHLDTHYLALMSAISDDDGNRVRRLLEGGG